MLCNRFTNFNFPAPIMNFGGFAMQGLFGNCCHFQMPSFFGFGFNMPFFGNFGGFANFPIFNNFNFYNNGLNTNFYNNIPQVNIQSYLPKEPIIVNMKAPIFSTQNYTPTRPIVVNTANNATSMIIRRNNSYSKAVSGEIDNSYLGLNKREAERKAQNDPRLERLSGGNGWSIQNASFTTDIPFARKGTSAILEKVSKLIGKELVITSALGTGEPNSPHAKKGYASHHNATNPKLDISLKGHNANDLAAKLRSTGYFSRISIESDHLDVQIDPSKFNSLEVIA